MKKIKPHLNKLLNQGKKLGQNLSSEAQLVHERIRSYLLSQEFEAQLDQLLETAQATEAFAASEAAMTLTESEDTKERIKAKIHFLFKYHKDDILNVAKKGAFYGGIFGPRMAVRMAVVAGGIKLLFVIGGVVYTILIKRSGEWSVVETATEKT